jgi:hypothetical protein
MPRLLLTFLAAVTPLTGTAACPCRTTAALAGPAERACAGTVEPSPVPRCGCHRQPTQPVPQNPRPAEPGGHCPCGHPTPAALPATPPRAGGADGADGSHGDAVARLDAFTSAAVVVVAPDVGAVWVPADRPPWPSSRAFLRFTHALRC